MRGQQRTIVPRHGHERKALQAYGVRSAQEIARDVAAEIAALRDRGPLPRVVGSHGDGTALASLLAALRARGWIDDQTAGGAALESIANQNQEDVSVSTAGSGTSTPGAGIRLYSVFTLPTAFAYYLVTGIEWSNKATVNGNVICGVDWVDADPPVLAPTVLLAVGVQVAQAGANAVQRVDRVRSAWIPGGSICAAWIVSDSATATFGANAVTSANNRKTIAFAYPATGEANAWVASTSGTRIVAYLRGVG